MNWPISEQITVAIVTNLQKVNGTNPYQIALNVQRSLTIPTPQADKTAVVIPVHPRWDAENAKRGDVQKYNYWIAEYAIMIYCRLGQKSTQPVDQAINLYLAEAMRGLMSDSLLGGLLATPLRDNDPILFAIPEGEQSGVVSGVIASIEASYRVQKYNPYAQ